MTTSPQLDEHQDMSPHTRGTLNDLIGEQVVQSLGSPCDLLKVQVRPLGTDRYRVNVFVGKFAVSSRISDSFFLSADCEGNIVTCSPEIIRRY
jgi:hypothetical protein